MFYETHDSPIYIKEGKSFDFPPHAHHNVEIMICTDGEYRVSCQFKEAILHRGDAMIAFPNDVHAYSKKSDAKGMIILVSPDLLPFLSLEDSNKRYDNFLFNCAYDLIGLGTALLNEYQDGGEMTVMIGYLYLIFGNVMKSLPYRAISSPINSSHFSKILRYVSKNYTQKLSLQSISERFGISACHLSRSFREHLGITFLQYLHTLRVEHAKNLLRHSQRSVLEIAYDSGFCDQRTFNRVFLELTHQTPSEYRNKHTKSEEKS